MSEEDVSMPLLGLIPFLHRDFAEGKGRCDLVSMPLLGLIPFLL